MSTKFETGLSVQNHIADLWNPVSKFCNIGVTITDGQYNILLPRSLPAEYEQLVFIRENMPRLVLEGKRRKLVQSNELETALQVKSHKPPPSKSRIDAYTAKSQDIKVLNVENTDLRCKRKSWKFLKGRKTGRLCNGGSCNHNMQNYKPVSTPHLQCELFV